MTIDGAYRPDAAEYQGIPANIINSVRAAANRTGVDFAYLMEKAAAESSFDAHAQATTSSARGLYQFIDQTWIDMVKDHGKEYGLGQYASAIRDGSLDAKGRAQLLAYRDNPRLSAAMAAEYTKDNADRLESALGRKAGTTDLYLAHFLGGGGAVKFLKALQADEGTEAAALMPQAARANPNVFYEKSGRTRSLGEIYDYFSGKFSASGGSAPMPPEAVTAMTAALSASRASVSPAEGVSVSASAAMPHIHARGYVRPVPATFNAPPSTNSHLAMEAILFLASLEPPVKARHT
jgi:hypothetical protein